MEARAFAELPLPDERDVERVSQLVLLGLLPSVIEGDIETFGAALSEVQEINGRWFSHAQGGMFAPGPSAEIIRLMRECGAPGVGQSSWGPSVYAIVDGDAAAESLSTRIRDRCAHRVDVYAGPFPVFSRGQFSRGQSP